MFALIITVLQLVSVILDKITLLEKMKFFVSIKKFLDSTIKIADKHHKKRKKVKKMKTKSNKTIIWLTIFLILNLCFSGFLFYKIKKQNEEINALVTVTVGIIYNNKNFQNNLKDDGKDSSFNKNFADSY